MSPLIEGIFDEEWKITKRKISKSINFQIFTQKNQSMQLFAKSVDASRTVVAFALIIPHRFVDPNIDIYISSSSSHLTALVVGWVTAWEQA